jgi:hypothetical protein
MQKTFQLYLLIESNVTIICIHSVCYNAASHICTQPIVACRNFTILVQLIFSVEERYHKNVMCNYSSNMPQLINIPVYTVKSTVKRVQCGHVIHIIAKRLYKKGGLAHECFYRTLWHYSAALWISVNGSILFFKERYVFLNLTPSVNFVVTLCAWLHCVQFLQVFHVFVQITACKRRGKTSNIL